MVYFYNDLPKGAGQPKKDELIYLQRKRYIAPKGKNSHTLLAQESLRGISQEYGVKLSRLYKMNRLKKGEKPIVGDPVYLRRKKPKTAR